MRGKKAFEMAISTIVIIVLSIVLLVALLFVLNNQTGIFSRFIGGFQTSNVDNVISACNSLVLSQGSFSYCCDKREISFSDGKKLSLTCNEVKDREFSSGRVQNLDCSDVSCG